MLRAGAEAAWLWACAIAYCNRQLTDGIVPAEALGTMGSFKTPVRRLADALVHVGLFDQATDGYIVHDYLRHNPDRVTVQQRKRDAADRSYRADRERWRLPNFHQARTLMDVLGHQQQQHRCRSF